MGALEGAALTKEVLMGKWGYGPFDNDTAADFAGDLDDAPKSERIEMVRAALASVVDDADAHIDGGRTEIAIAASALTVRNLEGGEEFQSEVCGPSSELPEIPKDLVPLAFEVISRLLGKDNDLWEDWSQEEDGEEWLAMLQRLRLMLRREIAVSQESLW